MQVLKRLNPRHFLPDLVLICLSLYLSLFLRLDIELVQPFLSTLHHYLPIFILIRMSVFVATGVYDIMWRYVSMNDAVKITKAVALSSLLVVAITLFFDFGRLPRSIFLIDTLILTLLMGGLRVARRVVHEKTSHDVLQKIGRRTLIYGAGTNGRGLAHRFQNDTQLGFQVIGFIDDDTRKTGRLLAGVKVLGTRAALGPIIRDYQVKEVILAISKPSGEVLMETMKTTREYGIKPRLITDLSKKGSLVSPFQIFRDIELSDLLSRPQREIDSTALRDILRGKTVLVTGAGGSIGSELCRQILSYNPNRLLILDHSEFNLYNIDQELRVSPIEDSIIVPLLVDVKDKTQLEMVIREHSPNIVFHAAAYKHVHLVEANPFPSIMNNIMGTKNLLEASAKVGVERFILISTDKAVNPAGIMGATKRACELLVKEYGERTQKHYCAVRFGNVLGSSGSLIPLLQRQINNGEPVTITHQDMARYFMLIPEAVSLVLNAAQLSDPGDIMILKMGDPIRIVDIAKSLIHLMGRSEQEVPIIYTGPRPGEKMVEELYLNGNEINTEHPDILVLPEGDAHFNSQSLSIESRVEKIIQKAQVSSKEAIYELRALVNATGGSIIERDEIFTSPTLTIQ